MHPDDIAEVDRERRSAFAERQRELRSEFRIVRADGDVRWIESRGVVSYGDDGRERRMVGVKIDVTDRKQAEEHKSLLVAELDHRVKNVLAVVTAVMSRTLADSNSMADFAAALDGRIQSMAGTHELLSWRKWRGIRLADLVGAGAGAPRQRQQRRHRGPRGRAARRGRPGAGDGAARARHQRRQVRRALCAAGPRRGALEMHCGERPWKWPRKWPWRTLLLDWVETGGPAVAAPPRAGYGTSIIRDLIPYEFGGTVDLELAPAGARCRLEIPMAWVSLGADRAQPQSNGAHGASALGR